MITDFMQEMLEMLGLPENAINPNASDTKIELFTASLSPHETMIQLCRIAQMIIDDGRVPTTEEDESILKPTDGQI